MYNCGPRITPIFRVKNTLKTHTRYTRASYQHIQLYHNKAWINHLGHLLMILNELWPPEASWQRRSNENLWGWAWSWSASFGFNNFLFFFVVLFNPRHAEILQHPCKFHLGPIVSLICFTIDFTLESTTRGVWIKSVACFPHNMFTYLFGFGWLRKKIKLSYQLSLTWNTNNFLFSKVSFVFVHIV